MTRSGNCQLHTSHVFKTSALLSRSLSLSLSRPAMRCAELITEIMQIKVLYAGRPRASCLPATSHVRDLSRAYENEQQHSRRLERSIANPITARPGPKVLVLASALHNQMLIERSLYAASIHPTGVAARKRKTFIRAIHRHAIPVFFTPDGALCRV